MPDETERDGRDDGKNNREDVTLNIVTDEQEEFHEKGRERMEGVYTRSGVSVLPLIFRSCPDSMIGNGQQIRLRTRRGIRTYPPHTASGGFQ